MIEYHFLPVRNRVIRVNEDLLEVALGVGPGGTVMATCEGRIVGIAGWAERAELPPLIPWQIPFIPLKTSIVVVPSMRRQGIASAMWAEVVEAGFVSDEYGITDRCESETAAEWWTRQSERYGADVLQPA
jgi:GNAT superfamily N-acetyltransferase